MLPHSPSPQVMLQATPSAHVMLPHALGPLHVMVHEPSPSSQTIESHAFTAVQRIVQSKSGGHSNEPHSFASSHVRVHCFSSRSHVSQPGGHSRTMQKPASQVRSTPH